MGRRFSHLTSSATSSDVGRDPSASVLLDVNLRRVGRRTALLLPRAGECKTDHIGGWSSVSRSGTEALAVLECFGSCLISSPREARCASPGSPG